MVADQGQAPAARRVRKSPGAFRTISEVASELDVLPHVLRFWESKFNQVRPLKRGGRRRYYRPQDVELLRHIRGLLYGEGYTIRGVQKVLRERGVKGLVSGQRERGQRADGEGAPGARSEARQLALSGAQRAKVEAAIGELEALSELLKSAIR